MREFGILIKLVTLTGCTLLQNKILLKLYHCPSTYLSLLSVEEMQIYKRNLTEHVSLWDSYPQNRPDTPSIPWKHQRSRGRVSFL